MTLTMEGKMQGLGDDLVQRTLQLIKHIAPKSCSLARNKEPNMTRAWLMHVS